MDAFLYPELFYGSVAANNSLFKVNSSHFDAASNSNNKRFVNLNHKIKLNPVEAQKLNSELLKFNYGSKKESSGYNTNRRNSNATEISVCSQSEGLAKEKSTLNKNGILNVIGVTEKILTEIPEKTSQLPKLNKVPSSLTSSEEQSGKSNINNKILNKSDPSLNTSNNNNGASILADLNRQSLEISPITVDLQTTNSNNSNGGAGNNKRYFYRYLLNKKYNSSNLPQQIFANVVPIAPAPVISTNSGTNKQIPATTTTMNTNNNVEFQSSSSFSIRSQPKEYLIPNVLNEHQIEPNGGVKIKLPAYQSQPNMMEFVEGAKLIAKNDDIASRKLTFRETFGKGGGGTSVVKNKENFVELTPSSNNNNNNNSSNSNNSQSAQTQQQTTPPFQTQFRLKPLHVKSNNLDLCDDSSPFINLKIEKKPATKVERVPIKLRTLNKFEDLTITSTQNTATGIYNANMNSNSNSNNINNNNNASTCNNSTTSNSITPPITQNVNSKTKLAKLNTTVKQKFTSSYSSFNRFNFDEKDKEKTNEANLVTNKSLENKHNNIVNPLPFTNNNNSHRSYAIQKPFNSKLETISNSNFFDIEFTRVASPHVLGKSTNDFKFISNSSVNLNTRNKMRLNQHFEMFQSNLYDTNVNLNNSLNLNSNNNNNNNNSNNSNGCNTGANKSRNEEISTINNETRKLSKTFNLQKLSVFGNCLS